MSFDCVVIGGGAAGMMAAIQCKENNMQTVIIEHTAKLGTKLLKTGNGKCNFSISEVRDGGFCGAGTYWQSTGT